MRHGKGSNLEPCRRGIVDAQAPVRHRPPPGGEREAAESHAPEDGPDRAVESHFRHVDIAGDQAAAEQHGEDEKDVEKFSPTQIRLGQRIGRQHGDCQRKHRIHESITDRVPIGAEEPVIRKRALIRFKIKANRPEPYPTLRDGQTRTERDRQDIEKRENNHQAEKCQYDGAEHLVARNLFMDSVCFSHGTFLKSDWFPSAFWKSYS